MGECHGHLHPPGHPEFDEVRVFSHVLLNESDRGAILVCGEILNGLLGERLALHMIDDNEVRQKMLGRDAPLSTFSARISASYAFGLIDNPTYKRLDQIRRVRNHCAHHILDITFLDQKVRDTVRNMPEVEVKTQLQDLAKDERSALRMRFVLNCSIIACWLSLNHDVVKKVGHPREGQWFPVKATTRKLPEDGGDGEKAG